MRSRCSSTVKTYQSQLVQQNFVQLQWLFTVQGLRRISVRKERDVSDSIIQNVSNAYSVLLLGHQYHMYFQHLKQLDTYTPADETYQVLF